MAEGEDPRDRGGRDGGESSRLSLEGVLPDLIRKVIERSVEAGLATFTQADQTVRGFVGEVKIPREVPREIVNAIYSQIDDTKNLIMRAVAKEVRDVLEATDIAQEIEKALTTLSFEIKTEIRFVPNDKRSGGVKPDVTVGKVAIKRSPRDEKP